MVTGRRWGHKVYVKDIQSHKEQNKAASIWPWLNLALLPLELQKDDHLMLDAGLWCSGFQAAVSGFRTVSAYRFQSCRKGS